MNHQKQIRYEFFKVVSRLKEKTFWGPGSYGGAIDYIIHSDVQEEELILDMVYMRPEDAKKQREELNVRRSKEGQTPNSIQVSPKGSETATSRGSDVSPGITGSQSQEPIQSGAKEERGDKPQVQQDAKKL